MATIIPNKDSNGNIISYRFMVCVGRSATDYKQIWRTKTVPRPEGLTPVKERKEIERQADAWAEAQKEEFLRGEETQEDKSKVTLAAFTEEHWWKDHVEDGVHTPSTINFYRHMKNDILAYFGAKKKLSQIDGEAVKRYIKYCNTEARTKEGKPYSPATVQHHFATLRNILEYAKHFRYITIDPCQELTQKEKPKRSKKQIEFLSPEEANRFIAALDTEPLFWQTFMNILITSGLRRGEAVGLQWGDIDYESKTITIQRNVTADKNSGDKYHIGATKTGEVRTVPASEYVLALLKRLKAEREKEYQISISNDGFIFCSADPYKPIYPTVPTAWQRRFTERHNLPTLSPHDLRHTAASLALEGGANLKQVQLLLGHSDPRTTMSFYAGVTNESQRKTVEGIEGLLERNLGSHIEGFQYKNGYVYCSFFHLIILVKSGCNLLADNSNRDDLRNIIMDVVKQEKIEIKQLEIEANHVRMLIGIDINTAPIEIVEKIKTDSSMEFLNRHHVSPSDNNSFNDLWADGFYLSSCGELNARNAKIYIESNSKSDNEKNISKELHGN